jgi:uncharacterized membrane protein YgaE (UPF0421/DUF939 family)
VSENPAKGARTTKHDHGGARNLKSIPMGMIPRKVLERWSTGWFDALAAAAAAGISWALAHQVFGHPQPVFAAVAAVISLAPGLPSRGSQAVNMILGLATGLLVGEVLLAVPMFNAGLRIALITFLAMMAAHSFGLAPITAIQGGVSALLVITLGPTTAGTTRLVDALVGTGVALVFSQVLLTPDPVRIIDDAARRMLRILGRGFAESAEALRTRDRIKADAALTYFFTSRESLEGVIASINAAWILRRWSVRGRLAASGVAEVARRYDRRAIRLFASTLLFAEALVDALRNGHQPPVWLPSCVDMVAGACNALAAGATDPPEPRLPADWDASAPGWQACLEHLRAVENTLAGLQQRAGGEHRAENTA